MQLNNDSLQLLNEETPELVEHMFEQYKVYNLFEWLRSKNKLEPISSLEFVRFVEFASVLYGGHVFCAHASHCR